MTMISFRTEEEEAARATRWADRLGIDRSQLLRDALRRHLAHLSAIDEADTWERMPPTADEASLDEISDWGPAEDWSDWVDAAR